MKNVNMLEGPIGKRVIQFSVPVFLTPRHSKSFASA